MDRDLVFLIPITAILMPVALVWIMLHYRAKAREATHLGTDERAAIETLTRVAERLEERIATLEKILDVEVPRWRQTYRDDKP